MTDKDTERFFDKIRIQSTPTMYETPCWIWMAQLNNKGYGCFRLSRPRRMAYAHRISWEIHNQKPVPEGLEVLHKCDNPKCVNPHHLFVGSRSTNMRDCAIKRRSNTAKLTRKQIDEIQQYVQGHQSYGMTKHFADKFGVHRSSIRRAAKGISFNP